MYRIFVTALVCALLLSGCVTSSEKAALQKLEGQPISNLIKEFGEPDGKESKTDGDVYFWQHSELAQLMNNKQSTAFSQSTVEVSCRLTAYTDSNSIVTKTKMKGDYYVCGLFTHKISTGRLR
ncbi:MAG: hypothetical protein EP334_06700 [Gammaproteobacteria bacterium]|nr:MAG: hypothetical protein EP334_06700 [Gammaproteobacteria bacterium]